MRDLYELFKLPCKNLQRKITEGDFAIFGALFSNKQQLEKKSGGRYMAALFFIFFAIFHSPHAMGQVPHEAEWNGEGYSLKKIVSNTSIQSGVNFSYTIMFSAPAGATSIYIEDDVPSSLAIVSVPPASPVNGVTPSISVVGQVVTYQLSGLPAGSASSGSFTIVVKFPEGVTCNGAAARNRAGIRISDKWNYTPYVSTTAIAADPWKVTKSIVSGVMVNPNGGNCGYVMAPGDTVTYRLSVLKASPYYGNVVGQQNMNNAVITDQLPPGAVFIGSSCGVTPPLSGNTFTWLPNSGNLNAATPWAYYYCDITVHYPAGTFPVGSFINNDASLNGDMCNQQVSHVSNTTCIEVANIIPQPNAFFHKYIYMTNRVPGCNGYYRVAFYNNGNVPLSAFTINDAIPSGITVNSVQVYGGSPATSMSLTANSGVDILNSSITTSSWNSGALSITVNDLQWNMTGSLPVGQWINLYIYFTVDPNPTGTIVQNCATFNGPGTGLTLSPACVSFTVDAGEPRPCVLKEVCSPTTSYDPGDILRFRLRVQNIGSADITGATIQDALHSNFTYIGNETYYTVNNYNPPCSGSGSLPSGATSWSGVVSNHSGNNLSWNLPDIDSDCQLFYTAACGYYGTWALPYYFIEFDVQIDSLAMPGVTPNSYTLTGGNLTTPVTSNTTHTLVVASFGQEVDKEVSSDGGTSYASSVTVNAGATARYRLNYKNTSNVPVTAVRLVDLLPMNDGTNDWLVLNRSVARGSQFSVNYLNTSTHATSLQPAGTAPVPAIGFAPGQNICLPAFGITLGCAGTTWGATPEPNVQMDYGTFALPPGVILREDFDVQVPSAATAQQTACNDFAAVATANFLINSTPQTVALTPVAAPPVCLTVGDGTGSECCESLKAEVYQDPDLGNCCIRLVSKCEVDSVVLKISNGSFSNATWNCGAIPNDYIGAESYTFTANNCAIDMKACVTPDSTGLVTVDYVIHFSNGEVCENRVQMDCKAPDPKCCDAVKAEAFQDPDLGDCCVRLSTECEVDSVVMNISNGVFSYADWNCGTMPAGYAGQSSYTFDANQCAVDMKFCVTPETTGLVTVGYVIHFSNGEVCENRVQMDCKAPDPSSDCCPILDFKLKHKWPFLNQKIGTFTISNPDPSSPICSIEISATPAGTFNPVQLIIDGTPSGQSWTATNIPATGSLSPAAANTLVFSLQATNYKGVITVCVVKCDGTRCCYEVKWNNKPVIDTGVDPHQLSTGRQLVAVTLRPQITTPVDAVVKYVSIGYYNEAQATAENQLFAVSGGGVDDDCDGLPDASWMEAHHAFFELSCPYDPKRPESAPKFNLVFTGGLPEVGLTMFDAVGNEVYSGKIALTAPDSVITTEPDPVLGVSSMLELLGLYPNPANGSFRVTFATGQRSDVELRLVNQLGQTLRVVQPQAGMPGIHAVDVDTRGVAAGVYQVVLTSGGEMKSRKIIVK